MSEMENNLKVAVAMSGGVDSSVAAIILKKRGYEVSGVYMKTGYTEKNEISKVREISTFLGVKLDIVDLSAEFEEKVVNYFKNEYKVSRTPNPCVFCNPKIKFGALFDYVIASGVDYFATGHYVRKNKINSLDLEESLESEILYKQFKNINEELELVYKGRDRKKDQSYFLYRLNRKQLRRTLFPVGGLTKKEVRVIAKKYNLPISEKDESQDICFLKNRDWQSFLSKYLEIEKGNIIDIETGKVLGEHKGSIFYTIGQREGLEIGGSEKPYYVVRKDTDLNILYVAKGKKNKYLFKKKVRFSDAKFFVKFKNFLMEIKLSASIRYHHGPCEGVMKLIDNKEGEFNFLESQRAVTPGQSIVFYTKNICLGGGIIV